jgi:hypothetical protein
LMKTGAYSKWQEGGQKGAVLTGEM